MEVLVTFAVVENVRPFQSLLDPLCSDDLGGPGGRVDGDLEAVEGGAGITVRNPGQVLQGLEIKMSGKVTSERLLRSG